MDDELPGGVWRIDPATREGLRLERIRRALDEGAWDDAIVEAEELLDESPRHPDALFLLGEALLEVADYELARLCYQQRVDLDGGDAASLLGLAIAAFQSCDLQLAVETAREVVRQQPDNAEGHYYLGLALERLPRRSAEAANELTAAATLEPDRFPLPMQLDADGWRRVVQGAVMGLEPELQRFWSGVDFLLEDLPPLDELQQHAPPLPPTIGAMYVGTPPEEPFAGDLSAAPRPDLLRLFIRNLGRAPSEDAMVEQLGHALHQEALHWLGHGPDESA